MVSLPLARRTACGALFVAWALLLFGGCVAPPPQPLATALPPLLPASLPSPAAQAPAVASASPPPASTELPPLVPASSPTPGAAGLVSPLATPSGPIATPMAAPATEVASGLFLTPGPPTGRPVSTTFPFSSSLRQRVGAALAYHNIDDFAWGSGLPGWYLSWQVEPAPRRPGDIIFAQMPRLFGDSFRPSLDVITHTAQAQPGSLWLIGNEPDVALQDNLTPLQYARTYHTLYTAIKAADPTAKIAIGGVAQPTPLRMVYLDRILSAYRSLFGSEMPVDVWNVHAFILREERDSWGVGIPPSLNVDRGRLYDIVDHDNMAIFAQQILDFRRWMAARGQRDKPLIVTEYGILMPPDYGFPPEKVAAFMVSTFDFFLNARDPELGYAADGNRVVQAFCWFSTGDKGYTAGNLFDVATLAITPVGQAFVKYVSDLEIP